MYRVSHVHALTWVFIAVDFTSALLFYVLLGCGNDQCVRVFGDSFTVISYQKFWCSWSLAIAAMEMCSSFSDVLFLNWRCRKIVEDCLIRFLLSTLLLELFLPRIPI